MPVSSSHSCKLHPTRPSRASATLSRAFSRVAVMKLVDHVIPRERFAAAHHGWIFANARTMWLAPLKQPHTCPHGMAFKSLGRAYLWGLERDNA